MCRKKNRHRETCMEEGLRIPSFSFLSRADGPSCRCPSLSVALMHFFSTLCSRMSEFYMCRLDIPSGSKHFVRHLYSFLSFMFLSFLLQRLWGDCSPLQICECVKIALLKYGETVTKQTDLIFPFFLRMERSQKSNQQVYLDFLVFIFLLHFPYCLRKLLSLF